MPLSDGRRSPYCLQIVDSGGYMDRLAGMEAFVAVADTGSFSAAGRQLGLTRAVVGKRLAALELALGVQLLNRTTRQVSLTGQGMDFLESSRAILSEFSQASQALTRQQNEPEGLIRVSAPMTFGQMHMLPVLLAFKAEFPRVLIQFNLTDRFVHLMEESYDLAIRIAEPQDSTLIYRRLAPMHRLLCAAPEYLDRMGRPQSPADVLKHKVLHYGRQRSGQKWTLCGPEGAVSLSPEFGFCANNGDVLAEAAVAGHGIVLLPSFIVGPHLREGRLERVLPEYQGSALELHALWPSNRALPNRVRMLIDFLVQSFAQRQDWVVD